MGGHSKSKPLQPLPDAPDPNAGAQAASDALKVAQHGRQGTVLASSLLRNVPGQDNIDAAQTTQSVSPGQPGQQDQNKYKRIIQYGGGRYYQ